MEQLKPHACSREVWTAQLQSPCRLQGGYRALQSSIHYQGHALGTPSIAPTLLRLLLLCCPCCCWGQVVVFEPMYDSYAGMAQQVGGQNTCAHKQLAWTLTVIVTEHDWR